MLDTDMLNGIIWVGVATGVIGIGMTCWEPIKYGFGVPKICVLGETPSIEPPRAGVIVATLAVKPPTAGAGVP
jgi:hypothetical protein